MNGSLADFLASLPEGDAEGVIILLRARGITLYQQDGRLFAQPPELLTDGDIATLQSFRAGLVALVGPLPTETPVLTERPKSPEKVSLAATSGQGSLASFLGLAPVVSAPNWHAQPPPSLAGIDNIILNFATNGVDWINGDKPIGVTVSTLDGQLCQFLPFGFRSGNLDEVVVKRWFKEQVRGKHITNANTRFEVHNAREWGCDLEAQGNTVSDVMHYAALLDDHRKRFALDVLISDFLPNEQVVTRVDERDHASYDAAEVVARELSTVRSTAKLRNVMWPLLDAEDLQRVRQLEDDVIYPLCEMEKNGSLIDMELLSKFHVECLSIHGRLMLEIANEVGFAFDHSRSSWQRLFEKYDLPVSYLDEAEGKKTPTFAEGVIGSIEHPVIQKAHLAGQYASLDSKTFAPYLKRIDSKGVLRYDIHQLRGDGAGTVSGRFSIGYVQQVPNLDGHTAVFGDKLFPRQLFISAAGRYLEADASQIELRLFSHFSGNAEVLAAYQKNPELSYHKLTWELLKKYAPNISYPHLKGYNFARAYGAKTIKLSMMLGFITEAEGNEIRQAKRWNDPRLKQVKEIENAYKRLMPEGGALLERAAHLAKSDCDDYCKQGDELHRKYYHRGYVKTILGRRSRFPTNYKLHSALNRVLQGSGADLMKLALVALHNERKTTGFLLRMSVHDSVGGDAQDPETLERVKTILNRQRFALNVPILWECGIGKNWSECK